MISHTAKQKITAIWDAYVRGNKPVLDTRGRQIVNIDDLRLKAILDIRALIEQFTAGYIDIREFKTSLDGYNKRNNLWGFTATKGQMFFNQLVKSSEPDLGELAALVATSIKEPTTVEEALETISIFEEHVRTISSQAKDKRKVPNPGSVGYFLSYFWQMHDHDKWPLMYTSLTRAFAELGIWEPQGTQAESYRTFFEVNDEIKELLRQHSKHEIENWDAEHAFWNYNGDSLNPSSNIAPSTPPSTSAGTNETATAEEIEIKANFDLSDYLIPKVARLAELGNEQDRSKASQFEKLVAEIFRQLDFQVEMLGQGTGRNPDVIATYREENTAFLIDAKAYGSAYSLGIDDRAIREYTLGRCPKLQKEGFKKIGFIIVSNAFKSSFDEFANDLTWNTDIKRFICITSEALLYLLAYKTKDKLNLSTIVESMVTMGNIVTAQDVIRKLDDI